MNHQWETLPLFESAAKCAKCGLKRESRPRRLELPDGVRLRPRTWSGWVVDVPGAPRPHGDKNPRPSWPSMYPGVELPAFGFPLRYDTDVPPCDWVQRMPSHSVQRQAKAIGLKWAVRRLHDWDAIAVALDAYAEGGEPVWPEGFGVVAGRLHDNLEAGWIKPSATVEGNAVTTQHLRPYGYP